MGIKLMSLNMISWSCFQLLKNHMISCIQLQPSPPTKKHHPITNNIKLIDSNGVVKIYNHPIHVSEVLLEFPKHLVCHSDSFYIGQKIPPLSENDKLQMGHKYFLLPKHFFQSVLSFVTIASFFASSNSQHKPQQQQQQQHPMFVSPSLTNAKNNNFFDIQRTPSGCLRIRVSDEFISRLLEQDKIIGNDEKELASSVTNICTTPQLVKDYSQLARRRKWKPKLETIRESHSQRRKLSSSFGIKRKNKKTSGGLLLHNANVLSTARSDSKYHRLTSLKFPSKPKIRILKSNQGYNFVAFHRIKNKCT